MTYEFSVGHFVAALIVYGIIWIICRAVASTARRTALYTAICIVVVNLVTFVVAYNPSSGSDEVHSREAAAILGFESGVTYPFIIDTGYYGLMMNGGFFTTAPYESDGKLALSFQHGNDGLVLKVDPTEIDFDVRDDVTPSVTINMDDVGAFGNALSFGTRTYDRSGPCHLVIATAFWACNREITSTVTLNADTQKEGLRPLMRSDHIDKITIVLSSASYDSWVLQKKG
jgi:hypothetical protein